jgi:hypothetical protein
MSVTFDTSEDPISWLKELALQNFGSFASHGKHQKGKGVVSRNNIVHGIFLSMCCTVSVLPSPLSRERTRSTNQALTLSLGLIQSSNEEEELE